MSRDVGFEKSDVVTVILGRELIKNGRNREHVGPGRRAAAVLDQNPDSVQFIPTQP